MTDFFFDLALRWYKWHLRQPLKISIPLILAQGLAIAILVPMIARAVMGD